MNNCRIPPEEPDRFWKLWEDRSAPRCHTQEMWDLRAEEWENGLRTDAARQERSRRRIASAVEFLRANGRLGSEEDVIDIGCGPGRFAAEFARSARHVTGVDLSPKMAEYGRDYAAAQGLSNVSFTACDFAGADLDALGWRRRFDLVFACITPAVSRRADVENMMAMSRGWCFYGSFVERVDGLLEAVSREVFGREPAPRRDGRAAYFLFNALWLSGWRPYLSYYRENGLCSYEPTREQAAFLAGRLCPDAVSGEYTERIYRFLSQRAEQPGGLAYPFNSTYAWMLWEVGGGRQG